MRLIFFALGLSLGLSAWAQPSWPEQALRAADPAHAAPPPRHTPLPPVGASALAQEPLDWRAANATVGRFARGHQDLIRWERAHGLAPAAAPSAPRTEPAR